MLHIHDDDVGRGDLLAVVAIDQRIALRPGEAGIAARARIVTPLDLIETAVGVRNHDTIGRLAARRRRVAERKRPHCNALVQTVVGHESAQVGAAGQHAVLIAAATRVVEIGTGGAAFVQILDTGLVGKDLIGANCAAAGHRRIEHLRHLDGRAAEGAQRADLRCVAAQPDRGETGCVEVVHQFFEHQIGRADAEVVVDGRFVAIARHKDALLQPCRVNGLAGQRIGAAGQDGTLRRDFTHRSVDAQAAQSEILAGRRVVHGGNDVADGNATGYATAATAATACGSYRICPCFISQRRRANDRDRGRVAAQLGKLAADPRLAAVDTADLVPLAVGAFAIHAQIVGLRHHADLAVIRPGSLTRVDVVLGGRQERHRRWCQGRSRRTFRRRCGRVRRYDRIGGRRGRWKGRRGGNRRIGRHGNGCLGRRRGRQRFIAAAGSKQQAERQHA